MPITITVQHVNTTVELLLWRAYGRPGCTSAMLEAAFALNRGIGSRGALLPVGRSVTLPDLPEPASRSGAARATVDLFGDT